MNRGRAFAGTIGALTSVAIALGACTASPPNAGNKQPSAMASVATPTSAPRQVTMAWRPGLRQLGVNVLWEDSKADTDLVTRAKAVRLLSYLVSLNVNSVALNFPFRMDNKTSSTVGAERQHTPTPDRVGIFLAEAAARGFRVAVRPFLNEQTLLPSWRGAIEPGNRTTWFRSYQDFLRPYAEVAERTSAAELIVGVELNSLQTDRRWASLITSMRAVFHGTISYSANYDTYQAKTPTPPVDEVGVDAYFPVPVSDTATVEVLAAAWRRWIQRYVGTGANKLVLHEVGIVAQSGAYRHPAQWGNLAVPLNLQVQANWYRAVCEAVGSTNLAGVYFWNIRMHADPGHEDPKQADRMTFVDRPAEAALRDCYAGLAGS